MDIRGAADGIGWRPLFYRRDGAAGRLGVLTRSRDVGPRRADSSSAVAFLADDGSGLTSLGELSTTATRAAGHGCDVWCLWGGNGRPLFVGSRIFALMGNELIEGQWFADGIREVRRVDLDASRR